MIGRSGSRRIVAGVCGSVVRVVLDHSPVVRIDLVVGDLDDTWLHEHPSKDQSAKDGVDNVEGADLRVEVEEQVFEVPKSDECGSERSGPEFPLRRPSGSASLRALRSRDLLGCGLADTNLEHQPAVTNPYRSATDLESRSLVGVAACGKSRNAVENGIVSPISVSRQPGS